MGQITYEDFDKVEIRVGKVVNVEDFPKARKPAYKLWIDFGEFGIKKSSAQITKLYTKEDLADRQCKLPPAVNERHGRKRLTQPSHHHTALATPDPLINMAVIIMDCIGEG